MLVVILSAAKNLSWFSGSSRHRMASVLPRRRDSRRSCSAARNLSRLCREGGILLLLSVFNVSLCAQKSPPAKPIDINTASIEQLQQLPGIGPVTAQSILDFRKKSGPFRRAEDLLAIRGISENRFKAIAPYIVVSQPKPVAAPKPAAPPAAAPKPATPQTGAAGR